ncbi:MAG: replication-associated recombination protein A [Clostridia bacterium]|nr:replication-associated recombination protein A [Clostridia bacterium]
MRNEQLADILRPDSFDTIVGQTHLFGPRGVVRRMVENGRITNMIFFGPPGTGKTTAAAIIAKQSGMVFRRLNCTSASLNDVKQVLAETANVFGAGGILLYLDEIQYFNRKQQQSLLEYMEDGRVTLIASTTENPHFYIYNAIISRSSLFEFRPVRPADMVPALGRALDHLNREHGTQVSAPEEVLFYIANGVRGDVRRGIGLLENAYFAADPQGEQPAITKENVDDFYVRIGNFNDDTHYDLLSCLQKSIRGSDPDATAFYVAKLVAAGELISLCRRLQVIASEDIGLAYPQAPMIVRACCESAMELGLPEGRIPLIHAALLLATAPKSNTAYIALAAATEDVDQGLGTEVPVHLQSPLFKGYKYPHDFTCDYVRQQYLPNDLRGRKYYEYGENKAEQAAKAYAEFVRQNGGKPKP